MTGNSSAEEAMVITLPPYLTEVLIEAAARQGVTPEELAIGVLGYELDAKEPIVPQDDWERRIAALAVDTGFKVTLADALARDRALSSEELYD
jgi:hypothetical protein